MWRVRWTPYVSVRYASVTSGKDVKMITAAPISASVRWHVSTQTNIVRSKRVSHNGFKANGSPSAWT